MYGAGRVNRAQAPLANYENVRLAAVKLVWVWVFKIMSTGLCGVFVKALEDDLSKYEQQVLTHYAS